MSEISSALIEEEINLNESEIVLRKSLFVKSVLNEIIDSVASNTTAPSTIASSTTISPTNNNIAASLQVRFHDIVAEADDGQQTIKGSVKDCHEIELLGTVARAFRQTIQRKTIVAYGVKHQLVFTGIEAVNCVMGILSVLQPDKPQHSSDRSVALDVLYRLANEFWLLLPSGIQQRKGWSLRKFGCNNGGVPSTPSSSTSGGRLCRTFVQISDDSQSLYRLTKDALLLGEITSDCLDEFVSWFSHPDFGIERKLGRCGIFANFKREDGVFTKKMFSEWMEHRLGVTDRSEIFQIKRLLISRCVFESVFLLPYYRFTVKPRDR